MAKKTNGNTKANSNSNNNSNNGRSVLGSAVKRIGFESQNAVPAGYRYFPDSLLISKRFMTRYADELLITGKFNVEFVARECAHKEVRAVVSRALGNDSLGRAFSTMHKTPMVDLDRFIYSKGDIYNAVKGVLSAEADSSRASAVLTEIMLHVIEPLGIVDPNDRGYASLSADNVFFPQYSDLVTDIWAREIEKTLSESRRLDVGAGGKTKIGASVVSTRLASVARDLRDCIEYVGDYAAYAADAMVLVRAHLLPRSERNAGTPFYPSELVDHPVIKAMAANLTIANMALTMDATQNLVTTAFLVERLPQVAAFFFESKRYVKVSLNDFRNHFTKSSYRTLIDNKLIGGALSYNLRGAPAAQAITEAESLMIAGAVRLKGRENATKALSAMYGNLMTTMDTTAVHSTYQIVQESLLQMQLVSITDPYLDLMLPEAMVDSSEALLQALAVSLAVCNDGEVQICEASGLEDEAQRIEMGEKEYTFMYVVPAVEYYLPQSGIRLQDVFKLTCAAEAIMISAAWAGSTYLSDKTQIVPEQVLGDRAAILGDPKLDAIPARGYANMELVVNDGVNLSGGFQFIGAAIRKTERDVVVVRPLLNYSVIQMALGVFGDLLNTIEESVQDRTHRVHLKRHIFAHLNNAVSKGVGDNTLAPYVAMVKQQCMSNIKKELADSGPSNDAIVLRRIRTIEALLSETAVERAIQLFVFDQVLQLLNLSPVQSDVDSEHGRSSPVFDALKADEDFSMIMLTIAS